MMVDAAFMPATMTTKQATGTSTCQMLAARVILGLASLIFIDFTISYVWALEGLGCDNRFANLAEILSLGHYK